MIIVEWIERKRKGKKRKDSFGPGNQDDRKNENATTAAAVAAAVATAQPATRRTNALEHRTI